jgi:DNA-binding NtrC family response regulator
MKPLKEFNMTLPIIKYLSYLEMNKRNIILIVDDQKYIRKSTKTVIGNYISENGLDYNLICANDASDFLYLIYLDQYLGKKLKLVISDDSMNFIDGTVGYTFLKKIQNCDSRYFKFILLTSFGDKSSQEKYESLNIIPLKKPIDKNMVQQLFTRSMQEEN